MDSLKDKGSKLLKNAEKTALDAGKNVVKSVKETLNAKNIEKNNLLALVTKAKIINNSIEIHIVTRVSTLNDTKCPNISVE